MISGPKPKPTKLKVLQGAQKCRTNFKEPVAVGDLKEAPAHFDAELKDVWDYAIKHAPLGLLKMIDASALEAWASAHVLHRKALVEVRKFGMLMKAPNSQVPLQSPFLPIVNKQALIMLRAIEHLGFSPSTRSRIVMGENTQAMGDWGKFVESA